MSYENNKLIDIDFYKNVKNILEEARAKVYSSINFYMVQAYWKDDSRGAKW